MKANKCAVCFRVKGKRLCRIKSNAAICSHCCARIRNPECQGCSYYSQAQHYAATRAQKSSATHFIARVDPEVDKAVDQALGMLERGNRSGGEAIVSDLFEKHPDLHIVQYAMGVVWALKGEYDKSLEHFDKAIEIDPYFVEAWFNKGISHQKKLKVADSIRAMRKVIELGDPADGHVQYAANFLRDTEKLLRETDGITLDDFVKANDRFDEAFAMMQERHWQQAIDRFQEVIALNPNSPQSHGNMGICYAQLGLRQDALASLDRALELDPNYEPALLNRKTVTSLKEGEKLPDSRCHAVDYGKDYTLKKRSMLEQLAGIFRA